MKTLKNILSAFALVALFTVSATAQSSDNATVNASATIVGSLTVSNVTNIAFGDVATSETPTIASTDAGAGSVSVSGATSGQSLNVSILYPATLDNIDGTEVSFDTYSATYRTDGTTTPAGSSALTGASLVGQTLTGSYTANANTAYIFVGGQIDNMLTAVAGNTYTGTITVTVSYN